MIELKILLIAGALLIVFGGLQTYASYKGKADEADKISDRIAACFVMALHTTVFYSLIKFFTT